MRHVDIEGILFRSLMAEDDLQLSRRRTLMHQRRRIVGKSEGGGTRVFEEIREVGSTTRGWAVVVVPAAKLVCPERLAAALARHDMAVIGLHL